jgi:hypothetical protein
MSALPRNEKVPHDKEMQDTGDTARCQVRFFLVNPINNLIVLNMAVIAALR